MSATVIWKGYEFEVLTPDAGWNDVGGIYIFAGISLGKWEPYYIGQADSFKVRLPSHERWDEARELSATHVHAMVVPLAANRDILEKELIAHFQPPLNTHHK